MGLRIKICPDCNEQYLYNHYCKNKKRPSKNKHKINRILKENKSTKKTTFDIKTCEKCGEKYLYGHNCKPLTKRQLIKEKDIVKTYKQLKSITKTADFFDLSYPYVNKILKQYQIKKPYEHKICEICNRKFKTTNYIQKYCSKKCLSIACRKSYFYSQKQLRFQVFLRDQFTCIYCGRTTFKDNIKIQLEHINARNNNGNDSIDNYATACYDCNQSKKDKILNSQIAEQILSEIANRNSKINLKQLVFPFYDTSNPD